VLVIYFCSSNAEKVMQVSFCDLHLVVMLADIAWSRRKCEPCVMLYWFYRSIFSGN